LAVIGIDLKVDAGGEALVNAVIVVGRQAELFEVVAALDALRRGPDLLDRGDKQADEDRDDGNDHEQLDERETLPASHGKDLLNKTALKE
jgi:hypothetical protein